jgi:hypothetical protein
MLDLEIILSIYTLDWSFLSLLSGAKVLRKLGVDLEIVAVTLEIAVWAAISHFPHK